MSNEVAAEVAELFIQRDDVKAIQRNGAYYPVRDQNDENVPFAPGDITAHLEGNVSYGHYLVDTNGLSKLFAFDIDLEKPNPAKGEIYHWRGIEPDGTWTDMEPREFHPRKAWLHPNAPDNLKRFLTSEMRTVSDRIADVVRRLIPELKIGVAYSGNKGLHVYVWTGALEAIELRAVGMEILASAGLEATRGNNFYKTDDAKCVSVELFPKQGNLDGKKLGNLMRLPLGVNQKSGNEAYFISLNANIDELVKMEALQALKGNPWAM